MQSNAANYNRLPRNPALIGLAVLLLALTGLAQRPALAAGGDKPVSKDEAVRYADALSVAFEQAADAIRPSVVTIKAVKHFKPAQQSEQGLVPFGNLPRGFPFGDDFFRHFFGERFPRELPPQQGMGSGVVVSSDGYILTNNHVVADADEVTVALGSGRELSAKVVGTDPMSDLAVIQVRENDLPAATLGDSDQLRVGEWVVAAGNPFGLSGTVTAGIVSAKGRSNVRIAEYEDFIQTDAAINPGNSGGPLVDLRGRVVGINTAIASHNGGNNGVGFAIPINMAKTIMDSLIHKGEVVRGWLGIAIQPLDEGLAKSFGYNSDEGALVGDVLAGGPAEKAGLKPGDIVTRFGNTKITDVQQLRSLAAATEPGTKVAIEVLRDGRPLTVTLEVAQREPEVAQAGGRDVSEELGLTVANLTPEQAESFGLSRNIQGVVVTQVDPNGLAYLAGIEPGNVILDVQGTPVTNVTQFREQLAKHDLKSGVRLLVQSGDMRRFVLLESRSD
jgi:serine protease Do